MSLDRNARNYAVPVRGSIWGLNYSERSERDIGYKAYESDYSDYFPTTDDNNIYPITSPQAVCPIRILKPHFGDMAECYADLQITLNPGDSDLTLKLGIGHFETDGFDRVLNYTQDEIDRSWREIHGSSDPLVESGGKISADLIKLDRVLPKYGDDDYRQDAFVLVFMFNRPPDQTGIFRFNWLNIHTSAMGVL